MPKHTRHISAAVNDYGDYLYEKQFKRGAAGRRTRRKLARAVSRRVRHNDRTETRRIINDERA